MILYKCHDDDDDDAGVAAADDNDYYYYYFYFVIFLPSVAYDPEGFQKLDRLQKLLIINIIIVITWLTSEKYKKKAC